MKKGTYPKAAFRARRKKQNNSLFFIPLTLKSDWLAYNFTLQYVLRIKIT